MPGLVTYVPSRSKKPPRSCWRRGMNASTATENSVGGWASGCRMLREPFLTIGFSASSLRRNCEIFVTIRWAEPLTRGSSALWA